MFRAAVFTCMVILITRLCRTLSTMSVFTVEVDDFRTQGTGTSKEANSYKSGRHGQSA